MGQRLNIEIKKNGKCLANSYYHWSGFTSSTLELLEKIVAFADYEEYKDNEVLLAVKLLEQTGAGICEEDYNLIKEHVNKATSRNEGLISISETSMENTRHWEEARATFHIDTKVIDFGLFHEISEDDIDEDDLVGNTDTDFSHFSFDDLGKIKEEIQTMLDNKYYIFEYKNKNYAFIE